MLDEETFADILVNYGERLDSLQEMVINLNDEVNKLKKERHENDSKEN